jgi:hypothetical protein
MTVDSQLTEKVLEAKVLGKNRGSVSQLLEGIMA